MGGGLSLAILLGYGIYKRIAMPNELSDLSCGCADLQSMRDKLDHAHTQLTNVLQRNKYENQQDLLRQGGLVIVGEFLRGPVGTGETLPPGEQEIIDLIENPKWYNENPEASLHPPLHVAIQDEKNYAQRWGEAEKDRLYYVIKQLENELRRRGCPPPAAKPKQPPRPNPRSERGWISDRVMVG